MSKSNRPSQSSETDDHLTYEQWKSLGPHKAMEWTAKRLGLGKDRKRKLMLILKKEWEK